MHLFAPLQTLRVRCFGSIWQTERMSHLSRLVASLWLYRETLIAQALSPEAPSLGYHQRQSRVAHPLAHPRRVRSKSRSYQKFLRKRASSGIAYGQKDCSPLSISLYKDAPPCSGYTLSLAKLVCMQQSFVKAEVYIQGVLRSHLCRR